MTAPPCKTNLDPVLLPDDFVGQDSPTKVTCVKTQEVFTGQDCTTAAQRYGIDAPNVQSVDDVSKPPGCYTYIPEGGGDNKIIEFNSNENSEIPLSNINATRVYMQVESDGSETSLFSGEKEFSANTENECVELCYFNDDCNFIHFYKHAGQSFCYHYKYAKDCQPKAVEFDRFFESSRVLKVQQRQRYDAMQCESGPSHESGTEISGADSEEKCKKACLDAGASNCNYAWFYRKEILDVVQKKCFHYRICSMAERKIEGIWKESAVNHIHRCDFDFTLQPVDEEEKLGIMNYAILVIILIIVIVFFYFYFRPKRRARKKSNDDEGGGEGAMSRFNSFG